jgi:hypothetical protein
MFAKKNTFKLDLEAHLKIPFVAASENIFISKEHFLGCSTLWCVVPGHVHLKHSSSFLQTYEYSQYK